MDSTQPSPGLEAAGGIILNKVRLIDSRRHQQHNLWGMFLELNIYEDLFSPCLSGTITIVEAFNLISGVPILGDETLVVEFVTPMLVPDHVITKEFHITKVDSRAHGGTSKNVYVLHFISKEAVTDLQVGVSKAYSGNAHDIVKQIFNKELRRVDDLEVDDADNKIKFISPYWSPIKCINYAAARCLAPNSQVATPNYLFYQTLKKFKLKSLSTLFKQTVAMDYYFDKNAARDPISDGTSTRDVQKEFGRAKEMYFIQSQDYINNTLSGALSHKVYSVDLLRKKVSSKNYNIGKDFGKTPHLDPYPIFPIHAVIEDGGLSEHRVIGPQTFGGFDDKADDILAKRISLLGQLDLFKIDLVVPGRTDLECGMTVNFHLASFREMLPDDANKEILDPYYSGKYLITAIQHKITQSQHWMVIQISKESSPKEIIV